MEKLIQYVYSQFRTASGGGATGSVEGFHGSVNARSLVTVLRVMKIKGKTFFDFGAGTGMVLVAAACFDSLRQLGNELPANEGHKLICDAVCERIAKSNRTSKSMSNVKWIGEDINEVIPYHVGVTVQAWPLIMIPKFSADADPTPCTRLCLQLLGRDAVRHAVSNTVSLCELRVRESYHRL
jgi:hypothetical protein